MEEKYLTYTFGQVSLSHLIQAINTHLPKYVKFQKKQGYNLDGQALSSAIQNIINNISNGNISYYDGINLKAKNNFRLPDTKTYRQAGFFMNQLLSSMQPDKDVPVYQQPPEKRQYNNIYDEISRMINEAYYNLRGDNASIYDQYKLTNLGSQPGGIKRFKELWKIYMSDNGNINVNYGDNLQKYRSDKQNFRLFLKKVWETRYDLGPEGAGNEVVLSDTEISKWATLFGIDTVKTRVLEKMIISLYNRQNTIGKSNPDPYETVLKSNTIGANNRVKIDSSNKNVIERFLNEIGENSNILFDNRALPPTYMQVSDNYMPAAQLMAGIINSINEENTFNDFSNLLFRGGDQNIYILPTFNNGTIGTQYNPHTRQFKQISQQDLSPDVLRALQSYNNTLSLSFKSGGKLIQKFQKGTLYWYSYKGVPLDVLESSLNNVVPSEQPDPDQAKNVGITKKDFTNIGIAEQSWWNNVWSKYKFTRKGVDWWEDWVDRWNDIGGLQYARDWATTNKDGTGGSYIVKDPNGPSIEQYQRSFLNAGFGVLPDIYKAWNVKTEVANKVGENTDDYFGGITYFRRPTMLTHIKENSDLFKSWMQKMQEAGYTGYRKYHGHYIPVDDTYTGDDVTKFKVTTKSPTGKPKPSQNPTFIDVKGRGQDFDTFIKDATEQLSAGRIEVPPINIPIDQSPFVDILGNIAKFAHAYDVSDRQAKVLKGSLYPYGTREKIWRYNTQNFIEGITAAQNNAATLNRTANRAINSDPTLQAARSLEASRQGKQLLYKAIVDSINRYNETAEKENDQAKNNEEEHAEVANKWLERNQLSKNARDTIEANKIGQQGASVDALIKKGTNWLYNYFTKLNAVNSTQYNNWLENAKNQNITLQNIKLAKSQLDPNSANYATRLAQLEYLENQIINEYNRRYINSRPKALRSLYGLPWGKILSQSNYLYKNDD